MTRPVKETPPMPMIDVYAVAGTFPDKHQLAVDLTSELMPRQVCVPRKDV